jgi:lipoprotein-anchoring transpeptidase ErfK/SrfK
MDQDLLRALNPEADFSRVGTRITIVAHREETLPSQVARIEVRKSDNSVVAFDERGNILASYPATVGSAQFPSPSGSIEVVAVAPDANYTFDPSGREWGPDETLIVPPGPNNPVGTAWISLSLPGYGIHGSPDPEKIGRTTSLGCFRLANWNAERLLELVRVGTSVLVE